jgi:two-component system cell cycle sensor histidine kinase/response regulator CckA
MWAPARPFQVLDDFPDPVAVVDRGGVVVYASPAFSALVARTTDDLMGQELYFLLAASARAGLARALATLADGPPTRLTVEPFRPTSPGKDAPCRWDLAIQRIAGQDQPLYFVSVRSAPTIRAGVAEEKVTDMAQRRRLEEELLHVQKMEAVGRLAGGIAHEFNNLLTTIVGAAELLSFRLGGQPEVRTELNGIRTATDRAATLVRRLLTFARRNNAHPRVVDLCEAVRSADRILASALGEEVELSIVTAEVECSARVDVAQIEQALLNLVINARDAMPGGGEVTVSVERLQLLAPMAHLVPGDYVKLSVSDSGSGMPPEVLDRVFEPFFTTKAREHGSGLGLAMVYGIVQQSGGHITVESTPGEGTLFSVYFPYVVPPREPETTVEDPNDETSIPRGRETVLVVEDDELVRGITVRSLRALGYRILLAEDGEDALRVVERHVGDIDLVVTDVAMPRMGGPELADRLSARNPRVKVLFVSGYSEQDISERMVLAQNRAFLDKPFTASMLARKLREMLDH